jgi:hypothetical protein
MTPKFSCGQTVRLSRGLRYRSAADGEYKVIQQLPDNDGELQYRVKSVREPHERVVKESDMEKASKLFRFLFFGYYFGKPDCVVKPLGPLASKLSTCVSKRTQIVGEI